MTLLAAVGVTAVLAAPLGTSVTRRSTSRFRRAIRRNSRRGATDNHLAGMVRAEGLEPPRDEPTGKPKSCVSGEYKVLLAL